MPEAENSIINFKDHKKQMKVPYVVYADFEAIVEKSTRLQKYRRVGRRTQAFIAHAAMLPWLEGRKES